MEIKVDIIIVLSKPGIQKLSLNKIAVHKDVYRNKQKLDLFDQFIIAIKFHL